MGACALFWPSRSGAGALSKLTWSPTASGFASLIWGSLTTDETMAILFKRILHNIAVVLVGIALAYLGRVVDPILGFRPFAPPFVTAAGWLFVPAGFLWGVWAPSGFYGPISLV